MIDFHCHLDLFPNPKTILEECAKRGIYLLSVTTTPSAWRGTSALAIDQTRVRTALGLHPQLAHERKGELSIFNEFFSETRYIGEIGLDGIPEFRKHWKDQVYVFKHILSKCSESGGRVMTIHSRRACSAVLDCIEEYPGAGTPVMHWFTGTNRELERAIALGCWFSVGPAMLVSENGKKLAKNMPRERVLTESDGPFAKIGDVPVHPWHVVGAIQGLADLWSNTQDETEMQIRSNLSRLLAQHCIPNS